ncbi:MAG TPA: hypothetical protein PL051_00365 [Candidatus Saccharibacteria bacterium]|nr:hypothetical protein [Candidatus Saccharibacteria bacterium]
MKLYLSHASNYDYQTELYQPLKTALPTDFDVFYPHDPENNGKYSKDILENCDVVLAEVSSASTGQGIELGWANAAGVKIVCFYKIGTQPSGAITHIAETIFEYSSTDDLSEKLVKLLR